MPCVSTEELKTLAKLYLYYLYTKNKNLLDTDTRNTSATNEALKNYSGLDISDDDSPWKILPGSSDTLFGNSLDIYPRGIFSYMKARVAISPLVYAREGQDWFTKKIAAQYDVQLNKTQKNYLTRFDILAFYINHIQDNAFKNSIHEMEKPLRCWKWLRSIIVGGTILFLVAFMIWYINYGHEHHVMGRSMVGLIPACWILSVYAIDSIMNSYLGSKVHKHLLTLKR